MAYKLQTPLIHTEESRQQREISSPICVHFMHIVPSFFAEFEQEYPKFMCWCILLCFPCGYENCGLWPIFVKFGMDKMPVEYATYWLFQLPVINNTNMTAYGTFSFVGTPLMIFNHLPTNDIYVGRTESHKHQFFCKVTCFIIDKPNTPP
jgi:hypothetical protein